MTRRKLDLPNIDAIMPEARRLLAGGYTKAGQWDLAQISRHLAFAIGASTTGFDFVFTWPADKPGAMEIAKRRLFTARTMRAGTDAPVSARPGDGGDDGPAVELLAQAIARFQAHVGPWPLHPYFGTLTTDEWAEFHTIHAMHHLSFLTPAGE